MDGMIDVESSRVPGATVLSVHGEIDVATAPDLIEAALRLFGDGEDRLVVDLSGVPFLDSSGISAIVAILRSASARNGRLALACPTRAVTRVFELIGLSRLVRIEASIQ